MSCVTKAPAMVSSSHKFSPVFLLPLIYSGKPILLSLTSSTDLIPARLRLFWQWLCKLQQCLYIPHRLPVPVSTFCMLLFCALSFAGSYLFIHAGLLAFFSNFLLLRMDCSWPWRRWRLNINQLSLTPHPFKALSHGTVSSRSHPATSFTKPGDSCGKAGLQPYFQWLCL